jgi:hypothetical protein
VIVEMKMSDVGAPEWRTGARLKPGEKPGKVLQMQPGMAKTSLPWAEIALASLLGGLLTVGLAFVGLWIYRWMWDPQALVPMSVDERNLYSAMAFGTGVVIAAIVLTITTARKPVTRIASLPQKRRPVSSKLEEKWRRRS